jgi:hypothetical protein
MSRWARPSYFPFALHGRFPRVAVINCRFAFTMLVLVMIANPRNFTHFLLHSCRVTEVMRTLQSAIFRGRHAI